MMMPIEPIRELHGIHPFHYMETLCHLKRVNGNFGRSAPFSRVNLATDEVEKITCRRCKPFLWLYESRRRVT